jgi:predicted RecB family endonuclease
VAADDIADELESATELIAISELELISELAISDEEASELAASEDIAMLDASEETLLMAELLAKLELLDESSSSSLQPVSARLKVARARRLFPLFLEKLLISESIDVSSEK